MIEEKKRIVVAIIPARLASTRFPNKPLAKIHGYSMIEHVYRRTRCAKTIDEVYIATCDDKIAHLVQRFGGEVIMTADTHTRGTDRVAEAATKVNAEIILNVQGDEPLVGPESLDAAVSYMKMHQDLQCINLVSHIKDWDVFIDQDVIKTVVDQNNNVLYFSRQPIPTSKKNDFGDALKQIGIYLFRKPFLLQFTSWQESPLEKEEKIDMLRILEKGVRIVAFQTKDMVSVDNPRDLAVVEKLLLEDPLYHKLFVDYIKK